MKELFDYIFKLDLKSLFITKTNNTFIQFFRYIFVGGVAFLADGGSLFLITTIGVNYLISVIFAFVIGLAVNYGLSKLLVFENSSVNGKIEFLVYGIIGVIGLGFTEIIMYVLTEIAGLYFMVSKVIATIIVLVWNFVARKITLYRKK
jgi:putative flippase GtrA